MNQLESTIEQAHRQQKKKQPNAFYGEWGKTYISPRHLVLFPTPPNPPPSPHVDRAWVQAEAMGSLKKPRWAKEGATVWVYARREKKEGNREMEMDGDKVPGLFWGGFQKLLELEMKNVEYPYYS